MSQHWPVKLWWNKQNLSFLCMIPLNSRRKWRTICSPITDCIGVAGSSSAPPSIERNEMKIKHGSYIITVKKWWYHLYRCHMEIISPPSKNNIKYLLKRLREKSFPRLAIWYWWLPQSCSWDGTVLVSVPSVGKTGKSALLGFYIEVRQTGDKVHSFSPSADTLDCWRAPEPGADHVAAKDFTVICLKSVISSIVTKCCCLQFPACQLQLLL